MTETKRLSRSEMVMLNKKLRPEGLRFCNDCSTTKSVTEFASSRCAPCKREYSKQRAKIPEVKARKAEVSRVYVRSAEGKELDKKRRKQYYIENREQILANEKAKNADPERKKLQAERYKRWVANNPDKYHEGKRLRRAIERQAEGSFTEAEWRTIRDHYGRCVNPECKDPSAELTRDHVVPLAKGGTDYIWNIQPLCKSCNCIKHARYADYRPLWGELHPLSIEPIQ